jgi:hypothetical protein
MSDPDLLAALAPVLKVPGDLLVRALDEANRPAG